MGIKSAKARKIKRLIAFSLTLLFLFTSFIPASYAEEDNQAAAFEQKDILYQEDFEDGELTLSDPNLVNGLTWSSHGALGLEGIKSIEDNIILRMDSGAYVVSDQIIKQSEYTVAFTILNYYNTAARVFVAYQDDNNCYSFEPTSGKIYRTMDGVEEELTQADVRRFLISPRERPSVNEYKIYFCNDGSSITISVDRDGYKNGKDYDFTFIDQNSTAVKRFAGGKIKLARVDQVEENVGRYWVNYDNILVTKGKLQATPPGSPGKLYVSSTGDDSYEGTEANPFKTISKAIESSYPGDEIIVEDGVYEEPFAFSQNRIYSEERNRLIIRARNRHKAIITKVNLKNGDYVILDGFKLINHSISVGGSTGVEVLNNYIDNAGVGVDANGVNSRVAGNYIYRCGYGIMVRGTNMLVENNEIERLMYRAGDSDYFRFFGEGHILRGNYMHGTRKEEVGPAHLDGFQTFDNNKDYARHIIIEGNFIEDYYHQGFMGTSVTLYHSYDIIFRNNVLKDAASWAMCIGSLRDVKVYNNLFMNMKQHGVGFRGTEDKVCTGEVRNNIFVNSSNNHFGMDYSEYVASNNLIFSTDPYKKFDEDKYPNDLVNLDPLFVDMDNDDFSLHPNSPAIDKGISLDFDHDFAGNKRPIGSGFDIGPFEYQGSSLPKAYIKFYTVTNNASGHEPFRINFDGSSSYVPEGRSIVSYEWDFGDGSISSGVTASHVFGAGKHTVKLTVTDNTGSKHTASRDFDVLPAKFPNLYLYLSFDTDCMDSSGKGMTVNSNESILFENSAYGRAIRFNNDKSRGISIDHANYLDGTDELTVAFFAKKDEKNGSASVIFKYNVYTIDLIADGFSGYIVTSNGKTSFKAAKIVDDTQWHHYAVTYDGSNIVMYLDGNECSRIACTGKIQRDTTRRIDIGRNPWNVSIEGLMDEIRIYDRALSKEEIDKVIEGGLVDNPPQDRILTGIITPSAIKGVANGTAKTASALGLPATVTIVADGGSLQANVNWNVDSCTYNPRSQKSQTFVVNGTVVLPAGVANPDNVPLTVSISVTVKKAAGTQDPGDQDDPKDPSGPGGSDIPDKPTKPSTPSTPTTPTPEPGDGKQDEDSDAALEDEDLITKDYPEMVEQLERLYSSADIRDNKLNPTYGVMMKREPVISITPTCQNRLKQLTKLTFSDIKGTEWYASHIPMAVYRKVINGFPDGTFKGNSKVTRAEFLTMLARFNNSEGTIKQKAEQDAEGRARIASLMGDSWYTNYILVAEEGLVYPDLYTSETIVKPMTRGEVFYALANYLWKEDISEGGKYHTMAVSNEDPAFSDTLKAVTIANPDAGGSAAKSYQWYKQLVYAAENPENGVPMDFYPAIMCLKDKGMLLGNNGESKWYDPISRAEALALFERLAKVWGDESN